jgi:Uncharacterized conserved protein (DUF2304).
MARKANIVRKMTERQSIFWIMAGIIIILFGLIPQLVYLASDLFAVEYPPSIIFAIAIILATYGIFNCYQTNAELSARVQELAMQVSLLNEENSHLKKLIDNEHVIIDEIVSEASLRNEAKTAVYNQYDGEGWC